MGFGFVMKRRRRCEFDFVAYDERVNFCDECYLVEFEPVEWPSEY